MPVATCKYDPDHGTFATPVHLRRHYDREHGDVYQPKRKGPKEYRCRVCGKIVRNPSSHIHQMHPAEYATGAPFVGRFFDRVDDDSAGSRSVDVISQLRAIEANRAQVEQVQPAPIPRHVGPWEVDDIVLPVVAQLAQPKGVVPVDLLAAIFVWRDATAVMLTAVTGPKR